MRNNRFLGLFVAISAFLCGNPSKAADPIVETVVPGVGSRGGEFSVVLTGGRLKDAQEVLFYRKGLTSKSIEVSSDNEVKVTFLAGADCPLGAHPFRVRTPGGVSELKVVHMSPFPVVQETEPNDSAKDATAVPLNTTVAGVIDSGDLDNVVVKLKKGGRLSAEVQAIRLGGHMTDMVLTVMGPDGRRLLEADDTPTTHQDPFVSFFAPVDGDYVIQVRDTAFGGGPESTYALHVGDFPRPKGIFPPGGQAGKDATLRLLGLEGESAVQNITLPADTGPWWDFFPKAGGMAAPTATPLRVRPFHCYDEPDLNEVGYVQSEKLPVRDWPVAFHGIIAGPSDIDAFAISARAGEEVQVELFGERIGSPIDSIIEIFDPEGDLIGRSDDDATHDSRIVFKPVIDGVYKIQVSDKRGEGGSDFLYRIEVEQPRPSLTLFLPGPVRKSQNRQSFSVPRGNRITAYLGVRKEGFDAPVQVETTGLPAGVAMDFKQIQAGMYLMPIVIEAAADAPLGASLLKLKGMADTPNGTVTGGFEQNVNLIPASGDASYQYATIDQLAVVVTEEVPYKVSLQTPKSSLARDGAIEIVADVERAKGFEEPLEVTLPYLPPGVEMEGPIVVPPDKTKAVFQLFARPDVDPVSWRLVAEAKPSAPKLDRREMTMALQNMIDPTALGGTATGRRRRPIEGAALVVSKFVPLELTESNVSGTFALSSGEQGKSAPVTCSIKFETPVTAPMKATIEGLPPRVTSEPVEVKPGASNVEFAVKIDATTPLGEYDSLICRLSGQVNGQAVIYQFGRGGTLKVVAPGTLATDGQGKTLSPLEALRLKERGAGKNR